METQNEDKAILTDWAYDCYKEGNLDVLVEHDNEAIGDRNNLEKLVMIAMWCIQEDPSLRPTMRKVTQMLEGVVEVLVPPCPCPFNMGKDQYSGYECGTTSSDDNSNVTPP
ncbi:hypothetical protein L6164_013409 [Bauhinia variegata]|nr:hypothetical protein L6164_013408 [Bauhinia variegata]KAI4334695.1 hypothetical protein L6164_013409 [Bauhinia variegata]